MKKRGWMDEQTENNTHNLKTVEKKQLPEHLTSNLYDMPVK